MAFAEGWRGSPLRREMEGVAITGVERVERGTEARQRVI